MAPPGGPAPQPGQAAHPAPAADRGVGPGLRRRVRQPAALHGPAGRKLEPDPARPRWLLTEPGMGYRYQPSPGSGNEDGEASAAGARDGSAAPARDGSADGDRFAD